MKYNQSIVGYFLSSEISSFGDMFQYATSLASIAAVYLYSLIKRNRLVTFFHILEKIDKDLVQLGHMKQYRKAYMIVWMNLLLMLLFYTTYIYSSTMLLDRAKIYPEISVWVAFFLPFYMICISTVFRGCLVYELETRFSALNTALVKIREEEVKRDSGKSGHKNISIHPRTTAVDSSEDLADKIINIHSNLCKGSETIQDYFSIQMLSTVTICFLTIVFNAFYVISMVLNSAKITTTIGKFEFIFFFTYHLTICLLGIIHTGTGSNAVIVQSELIPINVFKLLYVLRDQKYKEKLKLFSNNLVHTVVKFTAGGLFSLDKRIIVTVIGTASTYLVILIQLALSNEPPTPIVKIFVHKPKTLPDVPQTLVQSRRRTYNSWEIVHLARLAQEHCGILVMKNSCIFLLVVIFPGVFTYRILGLFPLPAKSHNVLYQSIVQALAERNHDVTIITSLPGDPSNIELSNYHEFLLDDQEPIIDSVHLDNSFSPNLWNVFRDFSGLLQMSEQVCRSLLASEALSTVLSLHRNTPFDLVLIEFFVTNCALGIAHEMNVTTAIGISPCALLPWHYDMLNLMNYPAFMPVENTAFGTKMTFFQRMENYLTGKVMTILYRQIQNQDNAILREYFGNDMKDVVDLAKDVALVLVNQHFSVSGVKPLNLRVVEIGGAHIAHYRKQDQVISEDLRIFLNSSQGNGLIYINWGSVVRFSSLPESHLAALRKALYRLDMNVIWKWEDEESFVNKSSKILVKKWLPQLHILCHPATRIFLTHGGLLSANEAAYCGKPTIVTPIFGDQHLNAAALAERGVGVILPLNEFSEDIIHEKLQEILKSEYRFRAEQLSLQFRDRLTEPLTLAIWSIENILEMPEFIDILKTHPVDINYNKANNFQYFNNAILSIFTFILALIIFLLFFTLKNKFKKLK
ncbi:hypothetical protein DMENIID0001_161650 [Sergentomyia squamirostris]